MIGVEIGVGVIIGLLFELLSDTEGTPSERESDSYAGTLENPFRTTEIGNPAGITK
jgi:hypothetical protein